MTFPRRAATALLLGLGIASFAQAADLTVSAAASLTNAFAEIGRAFEAQNAGTRVQFNFAASGTLLQQIARGAPVDVFASADEETMDRAAERGLVDVSTRIDFAGNRLVAIVPSDARTVPTSPAEVSRLPRVAIGQPASVPVGRYTKSVLERANLWPATEARMIAAQSVRQVLDYVARGEVDVGYVYATDAALMPDRVKVAFAVPTVGPIAYPIAVTSVAIDKALAARFVRFVATSEGQAVLARHGFAKP
jgi:molybdate transport system substrate-binding protein